MSTYQAKFFAELATVKLIRERFFADFGYRGVVVEVGGGTPVFISMSRHWVVNGWRAIVVEPNPHFVALHRAIGNEVIQCACAEVESDNTEFFVVGPPRESVPDHCLTEHASSSLGVRNGYLAYNGAVSIDQIVHTRIAVKVRRLDSILHDLGDPKIDILSVDVEGWEIEVMRGFSLERHMPTVVVLENFDNLPEYEAYMLARGYQLVHTAGHNYIFSHD